MKRNLLLIATALLTILSITWATAGEPQQHDPHAKAKQTIHAQVTSMFRSDDRHKFSRARMPRTERKLNFVDAVKTDANKNTFLAFAIDERSSRSEDAKWSVAIRGCYYAKTDKVYVYDTAAEKFVEPAKHPELQSMVIKAEAKKNAKDAPAGSCEEARDITI